MCPARSTAMSRKRSHASSPRLLSSIAPVARAVPVPYDGRDPAGAWERPYAALYRAAGAPFFSC
ncbi:hypothetical protein SCYAM73S_07176 [Streptomyces cyaneofuscatus]